MGTEWSPDIFIGRTGATFRILELAEGPWLQAPIIDTDPAELEEGALMRVRFVRPGDGEHIRASVLS
jgi:hypothetical protein